MTKNSKRYQNGSVVRINQENFTYVGAVNNGYYRIFARRIPYSQINNYTGEKVVVKSDTYGVIALRRSISPRKIEVQLSRPIGLTSLDEVSKAIMAVMSEKSKADIKKLSLTKIDFELEDESESNDENNDENKNVLNTSIDETKYGLGSTTRVFENIVKSVPTFNSNDCKQWAKEIKEWYALVNSGEKNLSQVAIYYVREHLKSNNQVYDLIKNLESPTITDIVDVISNFYLSNRDQRSIEAFTKFINFTKENSESYKSAMTRFRDIIIDIKRECELELPSNFLGLMVLSKFKFNNTERINLLGRLNHNYDLNRVAAEVDYLFTTGGNSTGDNEVLLSRTQVKKLLKNKHTDEVMYNNRNGNFNQQNIFRGRNVPNNLNNTNSNLSRSTSSSPSRMPNPSFQQYRQPNMAMPQKSHPSQNHNDSRPFSPHGPPQYRYQHQQNPYPSKHHTFIHKGFNAKPQNFYGNSNQNFNNYGRSATGKGGSPKDPSARYPPSRFAKAAYYALDNNSDFEYETHYLRLSDF